jgi:hypothetical protein
VPHPTRPVTLTRSHPVRYGCQLKTFIGTSNQLGEFESGVTAAWFGIVPSVVIGGLGTLAVVVVWARLFPELARVDRLDSVAPAAGDPV